MSRLLPIEAEETYPPYYTCEFCDTQHYFSRTDLNLIPGSYKTLPNGLKDLDRWEGQLGCDTCGALHYIKHEPWPDGGWATNSDPVLITRLNLLRL